MRSVLGVGPSLLLTLGLVVGCGNGDDELSKAEFIKQANAICKAGNKTIDAAADQTFKGNQRPSNVQLEKFATETVVPNIQVQVSAVRELDPPAEDQEQVTEFLYEALGEVDKIKRDPASLFTDTSSFEKANQLARAYGLDECVDDN